MTEPLIPPDPIWEASQPDVQEGDDNWRHRAANMRCRSCMWFVLKNRMLGRCRHNAPTIKGFPAVFPGDWCGDHKLDEEKL